MFKDRTLFHKALTLFRSAFLVAALTVFGMGFMPQVALADTSDSQPFIGGDLHTLTVNSSKIIVTGHQSAVESTDGGKTWTTLETLDGADVMGWATNTNSSFAAGHNGLYLANIGSTSFEKVSLPGGITDIHSIGASGKYVYLASPQAGLLASDDGGKNWKIRNQEVGLGFMGTMLVDPIDPLKVLAPDMQAGLLATSDGGMSWRAIGGPPGTMSITWNPKDRDHIAVIGMGSNGITTDGGSTWSDLTLPAGAAAISYSPMGSEMYSATLNSQRATVYRSTDGGDTWIPTSESITTSQHTESDHALTPGMDPNMPGMDHTENASVDRPVSTVLGIFGLAVLLVVAAAFLLRRKDADARAEKLAKRESMGAKK